MNNNNIFQNLTNTQKGLIYIAAGAVLLFYTMGIFKQAFHYVVILGALLLIVYGIWVGNFLTKINQLIQQYKKK